MNNNMIVNLGRNETEITYGNKQVLFSYTTPVAYRDAWGKYFVTTSKFSNTTTRHINKWVGDHSTTSVEQAEIDKVVNRE